MNLKAEEIKDKIDWERFLSEIEEKTFLDSWNWGEFNKSMGDQIFRFGIYEENALIATALVVKTIAKRGTFLFLPHGPNLSSKIQSLNYKVLKFFTEELKKLAKEEGADFVRIAPLWEKNKENIDIFKKLGFRNAPTHIHPELTWELNISSPEEEILMQMRKTTRYLIRKAQKNSDVEIIRGKDIKDIEEFDNLYQKTKERQHFTPFPVIYLKNEFLSFSPDDQIYILLGRYKEEVVSSGIFIFWQGTGFYHHGASSLKYPKTPVSYLLLWEAIKMAKEKGCKKFNFWGIAPILESGVVANKKHPWAGLSLFKMGFGGYKKEYVRTQDFIISPKYWISFLIEELRRIKRGL